MRVAISSFLFVIVQCLLIERILASYCYPDYCQNLTNLEQIPGFQCVLTRVQRGKDCAKLKFNYTDNNSSKQDDAAHFALSAYVMNFGSQKATAFNLSISDINFHRLITRYQNIVNEKDNACRYVKMYGNDSHPAPKDLYVSCPFSDSTYERSLFHLEYSVIGDDYIYSKKYIFYIPPHESIEYHTPIDKFTPFIYVDVSDSSNLALYIQLHPLKYHVMRYKVWLINNDTQSIMNSEILFTYNNEYKGHVRYNLLIPNGVYYVKVAALHAHCGENGCANSTSPYIIKEPTSHRLLIMIISLIWIPPVLLYALYHFFKIYRKRVLKRMAKRPNCLLVYSPTHPAHVDVMAELTKYLRCCNINAMIDMFDIAETANKDPGLWCNTAFQTADIVLIATSPSITSAKSDTTIIYRNVDNHLLRLLKENYPQRNKRYYTLYLPYCKADNIPEEARPFKKFRLPDNLTRLVKTIHGIGCLRFLSASDRELLNSIRCATMKIFEDETTRNTNETDGLLPLIIIPETASHKNDRSNEVLGFDTRNGDVIPQSFTTNITELNLLGEVDEEKTSDINSKKNDCEFRIDKLNL